MEHVYNIFIGDDNHNNHSITVEKSIVDSRYVDIVVDGVTLVQFCPNGRVWINVKSEFERIKLRRDVQ